MMTLMMTMVMLFLHEEYEDWSDERIGDVDVDDDDDDGDEDDDDEDDDDLDQLWCNC